jgi:hypothetical protein
MAARPPPSRIGQGLHMLHRDVVLARLQIPAFVAHGFLVVLPPPCLSAFIESRQAEWRHAEGSFAKHCPPVVQFRTVEGLWFNSSIVFVVDCRVHP